ncbi:MAG TPA: hypothetical protein PLB21_06535 [Actinomycetota bacterium]|nr:hypothetical protein [Actinomycetota bacterium]
MSARRLGVLTSSGVVAAATIVAGLATPGAAVPTGTGTNTTPAAVQAAAGSPTGLHATVGATRELSLAQGVYKSRATNTRFTPGAGRVASNATTAWEAGSTRANAKGSFQYRIVERGRATGYWVLGTAVSGRSAWGLYPQYATCDIYDGDPQAGGEKVGGDVQPYICDIGKLNYGYQWLYLPTFTVRSVVWSTVRGVISPTGAISLDKGYLGSTNKKFELNGKTVRAGQPADAIASGRTSKWSAFLRSGEGGLHSARGDFSYRIVENGKPTPFWIKGSAVNYRGASFSHTSTCSVFLGDPTTTGVKAGFNPYVCNMAGVNLSGRGDWQVTFTVRARTAIVINDVLRAKDLLAQGCTADSTDCSYVPSSVVPVTYPGVKVGVGDNNYGDTPNTYRYAWSYTRSATTSGGVTVKGSYDWGVASGSISTFVNHSVTDTDTTTQTDNLRLNPHEAGWLVLAPAYERITGDWVVKVDGRLYRLRNITFDLPDPNGYGILSQHTEPLPPASP